MIPYWLFLHPGPLHYCAAPGPQEVAKGVRKESGLRPGFARSLFPSLVDPGPSVPVGRWVLDRQGNLLGKTYLQVISRKRFFSCKALKSVFELGLLRCPLRLGPFSGYLTLRVSTLRLLLKPALP